MITVLLGLLGGLLADAGQQGARRGRLHELEGRLGLRTEKEGGDLHARVAYGVQLLENGLEFRQAAQAIGLYLSWILELSDGEGVVWHHPGIDFSSNSRYEIRGWLRNEVDDISSMPPDSKYHIRGYWPLPRAGEKTEWQGLAPWLAKMLLDTVKGGHWPDMSDHDLIQLVDWAIQTRPDLGRFTLEGAILAASAWHAELALGSGFRDPVHPAIVLATWPDGWHLDRLVTAEQLAAEGTSMGHCVGGMLRDGVAPGTGQYVQAVRDGRSIILSLRDGKNVPHATMEITVPDYHVRQLMGPEDRYVDDPKMVNRIVAALEAMPGTKGRVNMERSVGKLLLPDWWPLAYDFQRVPREQPPEGASEKDWAAVIEVVDSLDQTMSLLQGYYEEVHELWGMDDEAFEKWKEEVDRDPDQDKDDVISDYNEFYIPDAQTGLIHAVAAEIDLIANSSRSNDVSLTESRASRYIRGYDWDYEIDGNSVGELEVRINDYDGEVSWTVREDRQHAGYSKRSAFEALTDAGWLILEGELAKKLSKQAPELTAAGSYSLSMKGYLGYALAAAHYSGQKLDRSAQRLFDRLMKSDGEMLSMVDLSLRGIGVDDIVLEEELP